MCNKITISTVERKLKRNVWRKFHPQTIKCENFIPGMFYCSRITFTLISVVSPMITIDTGAGVDALKFRSRSDNGLSFVAAVEFIHVKPSFISTFSPPSSVSSWHLLAGNLARCPVPMLTRPCARFAVYCWKSWNITHFMLWL